MSAGSDPYRIIGYVYQGHSYCDGVCVVDAMGSKVKDGPYQIGEDLVYEISTNDEVEHLLDTEAAHLGIDRADHADSQEFPLTILTGFQSPVPVMCDECGLWLDGLSPGELRLLRCPCGGWRPDDEMEPPGCPDCRGRNTATGYTTADQGASTPPTRWNTGWASDGDVSVSG